MLILCKRAGILNPRVKNIAASRAEVASRGIVVVRNLRRKVGETCWDSAFLCRMGFGAQQCPSFQKHSGHYPDAAP